MITVRQVKTGGGYHPESKEEFLASPAGQHTGKYWDYHCKDVRPSDTTYRLYRDGKLLDSFLSKNLAMARARALDTAVEYEPNTLAAYKPRPKASAPVSLIARTPAGLDILA